MSDIKKFIQENPLDVIEKFGGIRPMANKLGVTASTIQGWKKRESIPDSRLDDVIESAEQHDISLTPTSDRPNIEDTIAQIKAKIEEPQEDQDQPDEELLAQEDDTDDNITDEEEDTSATDIDDIDDGDIKEIPLTHDEIEHEDISEPDQNDVPDFIKETNESDAEYKTAEPILKEKETPSAAANSNTQENVRKSGTGGWLLGLLIGLALVGLAAVFWPVKEDVEENKEQLAAVRADLKDLQKEQKSFMGALQGYLPEDMQAQLEDFKEKTDALGTQVGEIATQTKEIARAAIGEETAQELEKRLAQLEGQFSGMMSNDQIQSILGRFAIMNDTEEGESQLDRATSQLYGIIDGLDGRMDLLDRALVTARENSTALGDTFEGVEDQDLKAGALLLALTQFRSTLNRGEKPFQEDLALLYSMVGDEDTELRQSLDRLAPQAEKGVLTPGGLANEFRTLAGDIAVNSIKGDKSSITDQAKARLSKVLQIKKDGAPLLVDESGEKVQDVQSKLDGGDLRGAMSTLSTFDGESAKAVQPFMQQLSSAIAAQEVKGAINSLLSKAKGELSGVKPLNLKNLQPSMREKLTPNAITSDSDSGFTILPQNNRLKNNFKELNVQVQE